MAFDFYFAGSQAVETENLIVELNANVLKSFVNDIRELPRWFEYKKQGWKGKLLIDSGAFSIHRNTARANSKQFQGKSIIDAYIDWLNENDEYIDYAIELDHIPGEWGKIKTIEQFKEAPIVSWNNYLYMYDRLKSPKKLMPVFHQGEDFKHLENILNSLLPEYICISGNKELTNSQRESWYEQCYYIIQHSNNPNIKVHCLGSATLSNVIKYPFTSMDATSWIMTGAMGNILTSRGTIYVGDSNSLCNMTDIEINYLKQLCDNYNIEFESLATDYKSRMLFNIHHLYEQSYLTTFKGLKAIKRRLF